MLTLFALSLPGLVVAIILLGTIKLAIARLSGKRSPSSASMGFDMLETILRPGSEYKITERESVARQEEGNLEPFSKFTVDKKKVTWRPV